jgi:hypothetical protein
MNARSLVPAAFLICASFGVAAEPARRPIERATAGQWTLEKLTKAVGSSTDTSYNLTWVEKTVGRKIHLKRQEVSADGKTGITVANAIVVDLDQKPAEVPDENRSTLVTDAEIVINGVTLKCKKLELVESDPILGKVTTLVWTSTDVPLFGLVKMARLDKDEKVLESKELLSWGESGCTEKPVTDKRP